MPTILSHAVTAVAIGSTCAPAVLPRRMWILGAFAAMAPDLDVIGLASGVPYEGFWGHRGFFHSLSCAIMLAVILTVGANRQSARRGWILAYLVLAIASHGLLDACTDGGLGIALLSPFDDTRYSCPFQPIAVARIGTAFFTRESFPVIISELMWVWIPSVACIAVMAWRHRSTTASPPP